ncbi:MAG: Gfo/Idh/MocA family oxidoreductase [Clostridiaceae bacterium]|nr:Gfo/Idh/MocA family oxidoreductase [Clostridiaceae bacterium]
MKKIRWGVLGAGGIAERRTIPGLLQAKNAELYAVMEIDQAMAEAIRVRQGAVKAYTSDQDLIDDPNVDAIYIASPVKFHAAQAMKAIKAKKPFLIEKPLALSADEADTIAKAAKEAGVPAACGLMMRFGTWHQKFRELIRNGQLGTVITAKAQFSCWYPDMAGSWRQKKATAGGGALMDMGVHCIDLIQSILGSKAVRVAALIKTRAFQYEVEDTSNLLIELADGTNVQVEACFNIPDAAANWRLEFSGTQGSIVANETIGQIDGGQAKITLAGVQAGYNAIQDNTRTETKVEEPKEFGNMYSREIESFSRSLLEGTPVEVPLTDAVQVQRVVEAAYRSAQEGIFVSVDPS